MLWKNEIQQSNKYHFWDLSVHVYMPMHAGQFQADDDQTKYVVSGLIAFFRKGELPNGRVASSFKL